MKINFLSNDFENYLLNKLNLHEITEKDLDSVTEISLNCFDNNGFKNNYDFRDFEKLNNLKYISLQNFIINNYQTNEMNRCKSLEGIQFSNCIIKAKSRLQGNIQIVTFVNCKKLRFNYVSLLRNLKVIKFSNMKFINLKDIQILKELEKIYFENIRIIHFKNLSKLNHLMHIKLTNCKWKKSDEKFLDKNIQIEK